MKKQLIRILLVAKRITALPFFIVLVMIPWLIAVLVFPEYLKRDDTFFDDIAHYFDSFDNIGRS